MHVLILQSTQDNTPMYLLLAPLLFIAAVIITRAIFSIDHILDNMRAQTKLQVRIAKKLGVDEKEVAEIISKVKKVK